MVKDNIIAFCGTGIAIGSPGVVNNHFYHNRILENGTQVADSSPAYPGAAAQYWDDGYPSGGNYWSDYNGVDQYSGPNQNIPGPDGIGDTPYTIATQVPAQDDYPLMDEPCPVQETTWGAIKALFR